MFDNIYIGHSVDDAKKLAEETWAVKFAAETKFEEKQKAEEKKVEEEMKKESGQDLPEGTFIEKATVYASKYKKDVLSFIEQVQVNPQEAVKEYSHVVAGLVTALLVLLLPFVMVKPAKKAKKGDKVEEVKKTEKEEASGAESDAKEEKKAKSRKATKKDE